MAQTTERNDTSQLQSQSQSQQAYYQLEDVRDFIPNMERGGAEAEERKRIDARQELYPNTNLHMYSNENRRRSSSDLQEVTCTSTTPLILGYRGKCGTSLSSSSSSSLLISNLGCSSSSRRSSSSSNNRLGWEQRHRLGFVTVCLVFLFFGTYVMDVSSSYSSIGTSEVDVSNRSRDFDVSSSVMRGVEHVRPTLLSTQVLKGEELVFANPLDNEVYHELRGKGKFETGLDMVAMSLDKYEVGFGDSLTLYFRGRRDNVAFDSTGLDGKKVSFKLFQKKKGIVALYCSNDEAINPNLDPGNFEDAVYTHDLYKRDSSRSLAEPVWKVDQFPVLRKEWCEFVLWDSHSKSDSLVMKGRTQTFRIIDALVTPTAVHLALSTDPSEMRVHFTTGKVGVPVVRFGTDPDAVESLSSLSSTIKTGSSKTYKASDMCEKPANETAPGKFTDPGMLHEVLMDGLESDTRYFYKVGLLGQSKWSQMYSFVSAPPVDPDYSFSFIAFADQGCPATGWTGLTADRVSDAVAEEIMKGRARAVHLIGDLSYADGAAHVYDAWFDMNQNFTARAPFMISIGNHDYVHETGGIGRDPSGTGTAGGYHPSWGNFHDEGGECGVPVDRRFTMPSSGNGIFWYSYNYASTHVIVISSEHDLSSSSPQYKWLLDDLGSVDRLKTPWVIVESHRPLYESELIPAELQTIEHIRKNIESLMYAFSVDLFLSGHYHAYFRSCAGLYNGKCNNGGTQYVTVGTGGANQYPEAVIVGGYTKVLTRGFGYGLVTVNGIKSLTWDFIDIHGDKVDSFVIEK